MAYDTRETIVANPGPKRARKKAKNNVAKKLSLKQKLHFGSARQRAAAKAALKTKRKNSAKKAARKHATKHYKPRKKKANRAKTARKHTKRTNPGELVSILLPSTGNPARKGSKKKMATSKKSKKKNKAHSSGHHHKPRKKNPGHRPRRRNPGMGQVGDILMLGAGAVVGSSGSTMLAQAVLQGNNTGILGYFGNLAATGILAWVGHKFVKSKSLAAGILAGGVGSVIRRIITDNSLLGSFSSQLGMSGMGDYMAANFVWPQILPNAMNSALVQIPSPGWAPTTVVASQGSGMSGVDITGRPLY